MGIAQRVEGIHDIKARWMIRAVEACVVIVALLWAFEAGAADDAAEKARADKVSRKPAFVLGSDILKSPVSRAPAWHSSPSALAVPPEDTPEQDATGRLRKIPPQSLSPAFKRSVYSNE